MEPEITDYSLNQNGILRSFAIINFFWFVETIQEYRLYFTG